MLNENLKAIRKAKGLSQEELAIKLNVVRQTVSKWEQGRSVPDAELLLSLSEVLETPVSTLLGETVAEPEPDAIKALSEKLEVLNLQLARRKELRRKLLHTVHRAVRGRRPRLRCPVHSGKPLSGLELPGPGDRRDGNGAPRHGVAVRPSGAGPPDRGGRRGVPDAEADVSRGELGIRNEELGILAECAVGADLCVGPFIDDGTAPSPAGGAAICRPSGYAQRVESGELR